MNSVARKIRSTKGESLGEVMAAMVLLSFAILLFSALIIQSGRLMDRGSKSMAYYYRGQAALNARDMGSSDISISDGALQIEEKTGENKFAGLTPALRAGEGNNIAVKVYQQPLDWSAALKNSGSADENGSLKSDNVLFSYDLASYAAAEKDSSVTNAGTETEKNAD